MRARDALLTLAFAGIGAYGAWTWLASRQPAPAPTKSSTQPSFAAPDVPEESGQRRALGAPPPVKAAQTGHGVPLELARKNSSGIEALEKGEYERAIELFEACLAARPEEKVFSDNLAEALARGANHQFDSAEDAERAQSLVAMRRAHALAPAREDIELRLA